MKRIDFNGIERTLVRDTNVEVKVGDRIPDFRGKMHTVSGGAAPHKPGSTGYVDTEFGTFYVSVLNLTWKAQ